MIISYKTLTHAKTQLEAQRWHEVKPGVWVSHDRTCFATIHFTRHASVHVAIQEIGKEARAR